MNIKNNNEIPKTDEALFELGKKIVQEVKPDKSLLTSILNKIEVKSVTNSEVVRNTREKVDDDGRNSTFNNFVNITNHMNKYIKILSGGAVLSALVIALVFVNKTDQNILVPIKNTNPEVVVQTGLVNGNNVTVTRVEVAGEVVDVDSLLAELDRIDASIAEPTFDDSDLTASLINTNNYEIQ